MLFKSITSGSAGASTSFIGQLTTNVLAPNGGLATGNSAMSRRAHYARGNISSISAVWPGWFVQTGNGGFGAELNLSTYNVYFWVEYPAGVYNLVDNNLPVPSGTNTVGSALLINIPDGTKFYTWTNWINGAPTYGDTTINAANNTDEFYDAYVGTGTQVPPFGSDSNLRRTAAGPVALIGPRGGKVIALLGDSRTQGAHDLADNSTDRGNLARSVGPLHAYLNLAIGGDDQASFLFSHSFRAALAKTYCTHVIDEYGVNMIFNRNFTATNTYAYKQRMQYLFNKPYLSTSLEPNTSSTDLWATTANQTNLHPEIANYNTIIRALPNFVEISTPVSDGTTPTKWAVNGTANFVTIDGLHENQNGYIAVASAVSPTIDASITASINPGTTQPALNMALTSPTYDTNGKFGQALNGGWGQDLSGIYPGMIPQAVEFWFKGTVITGGARLLGGLFGALQISTGFLQMLDSGAATTTGTTLITDGSWHHIAWVLTSSAITTYIDGVQDATKSIASAAGGAITPGLSIMWNGSSAMVGGEIDEVALWNFAKYTGTFTPPTSAYTGTETGLIAVYHLDGNNTGVIGPVLTS